MGIPAIGIDVGGTKVAGGVVDDSGVVIARVRADISDKSPAAVVAAIAEAVSELRDQAGEASPVVGVGLPAFLDPARDTAVVVPNLGWRDVPVRALLREALGCDVVLENDSNAATWGEYRFGAGRGHADLVAVTIGTGIGGGIIIGGRLLTGAQGMAAEIGHMNLVPGGLPCGCGKSGCWEQYASGTALVRIGRELASVLSPESASLRELGDGTAMGITGTHITAAAQAGNELALKVFADVADNIAAGLADLMTVLDPSAFIIGGGVSETGDLLMTPLHEAYQRRVLVEAQRAVPLLLGELRNDAGIVGAADLARDL